MNPLTPSNRFPFPVSRFAAGLIAAAGLALPLAAPAQSPEERACRSRRRPTGVIRASRIRSRPCS